LCAGLPTSAPVVRGSPDPALKNSVARGSPPHHKTNQSADDAD
jgi:hypothetical protein